MNRAANVATSEEGKGITGVYGERCVLRFDILPFASLVVLNLESSDRLAE